MMYQLAIEPEAEDDLAEAYRWYENQRPGLGDEFIACVDAALDRICEAPELHAAVYKNVRQALIPISSQASWTGGKNTWVRT